jgi:hypothetical protein
MTSIGVRATSDKRYEIRLAFFDWCSGRFEIQRRCIKEERIVQIRIQLLKGQRYRYATELIIVATK